MTEKQNIPAGYTEIVVRKKKIAPNGNIQETDEPCLARLVSILLHPFLMGVYAIALLFVYTDFNLIFAGQFLRFIFPVIFLTCFVPLSSLYFLRKAGLIGDYETTNKQERFLPFFISFVAYSLLIYYFYSAGLYTWFISILVAPLVLISIAATINIFWRISPYMVGMGGLIGTTLSVSYNVKGVNPFVLFIILFILAGCLGVSQLILKRHTQAQVYAGFLTGLVISYLCILIGAYWGVLMLLRNL